MINTFTRTQFDVLRDIGDMGIHITLILMFILLVKGFVEKRSFDVKLSMIYFSACLFLTMYSASFYLSKNVDELYVLKLMLFISFIVSSVRMKWGPLHIRILAHLVGAVTLIIFFHWILLNFPGYRFKSIFSNPNYLAILLYTLLYYKLLATKYGNTLERIYFGFLIIINLILIYNTNSRAVMLAIGVTVGVWILFKFAKNVIPYIFRMVIIMNIAFIFTYILMQNSNVGVILNNLSLKLFGKSLYSGRSVLWDEIIQKITDKPIFGYGIGTNANDITSINLTAHNQYLQMLIEFGAIGFIIFFILLNSIWKLYMKKRGNYAARLSASFFIGILVYENLELTLFQNNYSIAMLQWLIITMGINFGSKDNKESKFHRILE